MDWGALWSAFGLLFVAELGDKTQLAVISQICKLQRPREVFVGASLALTAVTAIGAVGGEMLARVVPQQWLHLATSAAFVVMGLLLARSAWRSSERMADPECDPPQEAHSGTQEAPPVGGTQAAARSWDWRALGGTFALLFAAELGDKTQLAVLSLATQQQSVGAVFAGATLALIAVTGLAVVAGQSLSRLLPRRTLMWLSAGAFVVVGLWMGSSVL
jgi:putative Ca2+/H+ antiporter (TMEM165/GDT1 family)